MSKKDKAALTPDTAPAPPASAPPPVQVTDMSGINQALQGFSSALKALPEQLVNGLREGTSVAQSPATTAPPAQSPAQQANQQQAQDAIRRQNAAKQGHKPPNRFVRSWFGLDENGQKR